MRNNKTKQQGFNLTELLIVVAIVAIIAAVALPSYNDSVRKSKRAEGKSFLLEVAQLQERHYSEYGGYASTFDDSAAASETNIPISTTSENGYYTLSNTFTAVTAPARVQDFDLTVTPNGSFSDPDCGYLTLDHRGETGSETSNDICW